MQQKEKIGLTGYSPDDHYHTLYFAMWLKNKNSFIVCFTIICRELIYIFITKDKKFVNKTGGWIIFKENIYMCC